MEVNSKTDLEAAEASIIDNTEIEAEVVVDERLVTNAVNSEDEWSWSGSEVTNTDVWYPAERADVSVTITKPTHSQYQAPNPASANQRPVTRSHNHSRPIRGQYQAPAHGYVLSNLPAPPPGYAHTRAAQVPTTTIPSPLTRLQQRIQSNINTLGSLSTKLRGALSRIATARDGSHHANHHYHHHHHDGAVSVSKIRDNIKSALGLPQTLSPVG